MYTQHNSIVLRERLGNSIGVKIQRGPFFDHINAIDSCWPQVMFNLNIEFDQIDYFIDDVTKGIAKEIYPKYFVTEIDQQDSPVLVEILKRDFKVGHWSVMQHDLKTSAPSAETSTFKIKRVVNSEQLAHWLRICETELMKGKMDEKMFSSNLNTPDILMYLGYENDIPVSTSLIFIDKTESGLYFIATEDEHRGKGYGKAITDHAINIAISHGCLIMNLEATDKGLPVYERSGFINYGAVKLINFAQKKDEK